MQFEFKSTDLNVSTDQFLVGTEKTFVLFVFVCGFFLFCFVFFTLSYNMQHLFLLFTRSYIH